MRAGAICLYLVFRVFQFRSVYLGCRGLFDIFWILDMLAPGDAPLLSLACILQPSGVFFAIAAKMGLRQINLKSGKYLDTAIKHIAHFAPFHEGQVICLVNQCISLSSLSSLSHDVVFFSHPLPRLRSLIAIQLEMHLVL